MKTLALGRALILSALALAPAAAQGGRSPYARWKHGPPADPSFFPIAVWLQSPRRAEEYRRLGINLYLGLWKGPTEEQLAALSKARMPVICNQNAVGLAHRNDDLIVAWMHGDEPDNAQSLGKGKGYGPPIEPAKIVADYKRIRAADPTRPVVLNLGQGVAWDGWRGRGTRTGHPEDYPRYLRGCDIASFDIYPACHPREEVAGKLWYVARGVERLCTWRSRGQPVWCCIECTHINNPQARASPAQVKAEVWMALIHGAQGLIYFSHQFKPRFIEAGLLADPPMARAVQRINRQIHALAPVLNTPTLTGQLQVRSNPQTPIRTMVKRKEGSLYIFAVAMRAGAADATFMLPRRKAPAAVVVLGEERRIPLRAGRFADHFAGWDVHLYKTVQSR